MSSRTSLSALALLTVAAAATVAAPAQAINYIPSANGITWDVNDAAMPGLDTGSIRATTDNSVLSVAGLRVNVDGVPKHRMDGELLRGFGLTFDGVDEFTTTKAVNLSGIEISRHLKFARTANWGRWVDSFKNTTTSPKYVRISFGGIFGQNNGENQSEVVDSSSGDTGVTPADSWVEHATPNASATTPTSGPTQNGPSAVVLGTPGTRGALAWTGIFNSRNPFGSSIPTEGMEANLRGYVRTLTIKPGETVSLVHFVVIGRNETGGGRAAGTQIAAVRTAAASLASTPVLDDLSVGQKCTIVNFTIAGLDCSTVATPQPEHDSPTVSDEPVTTSEYDVVGKTLTQLQDDMTAGKTTSQEIVRAYLDRIAAYDTGQFGLHSFIKVADDAMAQAKAADEARAAGKKSDLLGIPVAVKDLYDTKDMPMTHGSLVFEGFRPEKDAFQVAKMRAAGAIVIGKTNMSEFANSGRHSESPWGQVWNAIQPSSTAQGSSGGSGASVAASFATFSMGSQTGVSLYAPSAAGGLVSLRGTDGLSSGAGVAPLTFLQDYAGPLARTVTDLAKILNVTTGTDPEDIGTVQADADSKRPADWTTVLKADALKGAKIGLVPGQFTTPSYGTQGSIDRYNAILDQLRAAGVEFVDMTGSVAAPPNVPGNLGNEGWFEWIRTHPNSPYAHPNEIIASPKKLPYNRSTSANATDMTDAQVQAARDRRTAYKANWKTYLDANGVDAVLYPGNTSDFADNDTAALGASFGSPPTSNIGIPGMVVPVGINDHGHPLSMQFVGRAWDDAKMVGFGYALEQLASTPITATELPKLRYDATATPVDVEIEKVPEPQTEAPTTAPSTNGTQPTVPPTVSGATAKAPSLARRFSTRTTRIGKRTLRTTGTVLLPTGTTRAVACSGKVQVVVKAGKRTLSTKQSALGAKCTFASRVTLRAASLRGAATVTVQVRFLGNAALKPESASSVRMTVR
ncbi:amidase family protein [Solirubrobacter phytolaccae]|uniref:Amidase family protein n=1 Tax=Solirubrobacter phytolaccae TaxID=1404360 RepID=A0A9X3NC83_9ACTN|nr:amidase family protein [Solirubrobacter phytolaccae]MDA0179967.1 amidase family protein [Solirubrobacter phytolaccae]